MTKRVSAAQAKARLSELMSQVAYGGERIIIERRGKPLAVLIGVGELERLERRDPDIRNPDLFESLSGAFGDVPDEEIDQLFKEIVESRQLDFGRPPPFADWDGEDLKS